MEQPGVLTLLGFGENGWGLNLILATFTTLAVTLLAFAFGGVFGAIVARAKLTGGVLARGLGDVYTTVLRGVPDLLVIYLLYFGGSQLLSTLYHMMGGSGFVGINAFFTGALAVGVVSGPTRRRSSAALIWRSRRASLRPRVRSACRVSCCFAGSCCRRFCASPFPVSATSGGSR